ncbi:hypothetical protein [Nannocystis radixulma]|uniref:Uncharacterized protein n=1 Tax=Nannocystis radixulma TaxID=2995305 RepID=A0ABT5BQ39_9BACT|nr:hypothetical protein [Nannocystis radixulma]MDC0675051.1 hypothetical protein [Nannocystis radixulma]
MHEGPLRIRRCRRSAEKRPAEARVGGVVDVSAYILDSKRVWWVSAESCEVLLAHSFAAEIQDPSNDCDELARGVAIVGDPLVVVGVVDGGTVMMLVARPGPCSSPAITRAHGHRGRPISGHM